MLRTIAAFAAAVALTACGGGGTGQSEAQALTNIATITDVGEQALIQPPGSVDYSGASLWYTPNLLIDQEGSVVVSRVELTADFDADTILGSMTDFTGAQATVTSSNELELSDEKSFVATGTLTGTITGTLADITMAGSVTTDEEVEVLFNGDIDATFYGPAAETIVGVGTVAIDDDPGALMRLVATAD